MPLERRTGWAGMWTAMVMAFAIAFTTAPAISAQVRGQTSKKISKGPEKLDRKAVAAKLQKFTDTIASKVVSERLRKRGQGAVNKWLRGFQVVQSKHYLVYTNGPKTTVKRFAKSLEELYAYVKKKWPFEDLSHHLTAYVFAQDAEYFGFCVNVVGWSRASAEGTAGHATGAYYATYYQSPKSNVVMHEATHQVVHACLKVPGIGSWFQEGMAVYIEKSILGGRVSGGMRADLRNGNFYDIRTLVGINSLLGDPRGNGSRNYDHAGCVIEFMIDTVDPRMKGKFPDFLAAARRGYGRSAKFSAHLFEQVYGMDLDQMQEAFFDFHGIEKKRRRRHTGAGSGGE